MLQNEVQNDVRPCNTNSLTSKRTFLANDICDLESLLVKTSWILQYISRILQKHLSRINEGTLQKIENLSLYYHHPFKETMFQTLDHLDLLLELEKDKTLNFFVDTFFSYHRPFKELCYLWNSYGIVTLVDKLNALFAFSLLSLKCLGNFPSIVPFNASISNVVPPLLLFEGIDSRTNPSKGGADGITRKVQRTVELLQGPVTRAMARRIEEEHLGKIARFKKMIQDLAWSCTCGKPLSRCELNIYLEWEKKVEKVSNCYNLIEDGRIRLVRSSFTDYPIPWWNRVIEYGKMKGIDWNQMKEGGSHTTIQATSLSTRARAKTLEYEYFLKKV
ncbi:hypothetical protein M9H77_17811 [Catharanthus roseus]|uniref:Uncharacterized protein n=1 Tax=Catharanthus roseus TaxID=4058 RepID=A0ACC0B604_CATRO|nr:hypothetical protein M9H77_17811 [Catharanthus roseus]